MREPTPDSLAAASPEGSETPRRSRWQALALGLAAIAGLVLIARTGGEALPAAAEWVQGLGAWGPAAFIALYALAIVLFVPGSLLTLAGGARCDTAKKIPMSARTSLSKLTQTQQLLLQPLCTLSLLDQPEPHQ